MRFVTASPSWSESEQAANAATEVRNMTHSHEASTNVHVFVSTQSDLAHCPSGSSVVSHREKHSPFGNVTTTYNRNNSIACTYHTAEIFNQGVKFSPNLPVFSSECFTGKTMHYVYA